MNDEQVERIASEIGDTFIDYKIDAPIDQWDCILTKLRAAGFDVYRPDEFFLVPSKAQEDPDFVMPPLVGGDA